MIRRPVSASISGTFAFIATSMVPTPSPQSSSAAPSCSGEAAIAGSAKSRMNSAPPQRQSWRWPKRAISDGTARKPTTVPTGSIRKHIDRVNRPTSSAAFTSGMRGSQTARPSAFSAKTRRMARTGDRRSIGRARAIGGPYPRTPGIFENRERIGAEAAVAFGPL